MNDDKFNVEEYQQGFNEGYLISKYHPELSEALSSALTDSSRSVGFKDGIYELQIEKNKDKDYYPDWLREDRLENLDKDDIDFDLDKDIDMDKE
jgi:hypothetical protein